MSTFLSQDELYMILASNKWNVKNHVLVGSVVWPGTLILMHVIWVGVQERDHSWQGKNITTCFRLELKGVTDQTRNKGSNTKNCEEPTLYKS